MQKDSGASEECHGAGIRRPTHNHGIIHRLHLRREDFVTYGSPRGAQDDRLCSKGHLDKVILNYIIGVRKKPLTHPLKDRFVCITEGRG